MKKLAALFLLLFAASVAHAQKPENFQLLGETGGNKFYVNYKDAKGKLPTDIVFYGALVIGKDVYISTFRGNCQDQTVAQLSEYKLNSDVVHTVEKPVAEKVPRGSAIEAALTLTCRKRFGELI